MTKQKNLRELFHDTLKDIYFAEKKILAALPKMAKAAQSEELKAAFQKHEGETEVIRMNGYAPLIAFDPGADGVPYASILHKDIFVPNRMPGNSIIIAMPFSTISADPQQSIIFHSRELRLKRHNESVAVLAAKRL